MSQRPPAVSSSNFQAIFYASIKEFEKKTKNDLLVHPLMAQLLTCSSPTDILAVLRTQVQQFEQSTSADDKLTKWLNPTVNVLYAFSAALGEGVGLVFSPAKVIFAGAGVLLLAAKDVVASQDALIDIFERIESFFRRLEEYSEVPTTEAMRDTIVKIMVEVLGIFGIVTKEMKDGRAKRYLKKLIGRRDIEDALGRLDRLTQQEMQMAIVQVLKVSHEVKDGVETVSEQVLGVDDKIKGVDNKVIGVDEKVKGVDNKVKDVDDKVNVAMKGTFGTLAAHKCNCKHGIRIDGKETKALVQQTANNIDEEKRS
ncbi:hypothetical protein H4582DRAFT_992132 [Lactarius indigo]|nr:hypothetical protein H4582DRAFT_992132 [Lactarius indigo]